MQEILVTTLETNRDAGYEAISKAPPPSERYRQFKMLDYLRKVVTIEPVLAFDPDIFSAWIRDQQPEYVWLGFNSKPRSIHLPEPSREEVLRFAESLTQAGITQRGKDLRGDDLPADDPPAGESPPVVTQRQREIGNYDQLEADKAERLRATAKRIRDKVQKTLVDIFEIGTELLGVNESLEHGQFGPWIQGGIRLGGT